MNTDMIYVLTDAAASCASPSPRLACPHYPFLPSSRYPGDPKIHIEQHITYLLTPIVSSIPAFPQESRRTTERTPRGCWPTPRQSRRNSLDLVIWSPCNIHRVE
jgi:hypothetical protein